MHIFLIIILNIAHIRGTSYCVPHIHAENDAALSFLKTFILYTFLYDICFRIVNFLNYIYAS